MHSSGREVTSFNYNQLDRMGDDMFGKLGMPRMDFGRTKAL